ncbi:MAG: PTS sugar transporter subunit IIA [Candidatus Omnitrophica bacterium]|nr:PTS sugar transporter subunit IIA [Candidatus Omnitrophota bacterium]
MTPNQIMTVRELAEYLKLHEREDSEKPDTAGSFSFMTNDPGSNPLCNSDDYLQQKIMDSKDPELDLLINSGDHPIPLSKMIDESLIDLNFQAKSRNQALSQLAKLATLGRPSTYEETYLELERRENISSTAIGNGVAIPHSRFPNNQDSKHPKLIIARSACGVHFDAQDNKKIFLFIMPCAPNHYMHLRMLAQIAKLLRIPNLLTRFKNTTEKRHILSIIHAFEQLKVLP